MNPQQQTQVLENLQDIKDMAHELIYMNLSDDNEVNRIANEIFMKAALSIELIYNVKNIQKIEPEYEFKLPHSY
jgi:3-dehydroquinate dehydratase